jgi:hypothetical protein
MGKKIKYPTPGDFAHPLSRFDPRQVRYAADMEADADFSFADGANVEALRPGKRKGGKIKTVIENTKPEL